MDLTHLLLGVSVFSQKCCAEVRSAITDKRTALASQWHTRVDPLNSHFNLCYSSVFMKTIYYTATSLNGYIADAQNSLEWLMQFGDPESSYLEFIAEVGAIAMGSTTYEWLLANHIYKEADSPQAWPYTQPSWVFTSRTLPEVPGADVRFVNGDVRPVHAAMRAAAPDKNVWVVGGGELVGQFHDAGLLDELIVQIAPVTLSGGAPLLPRTIAMPPLKLIEVREFSKAFVEVRYEVPRGGA
jgi:dihydrofolate reductase